MSVSEKNNASSAGLCSSTPAFSRGARNSDAKGPEIMELRAEIERNRGHIAQNRSEYGHNGRRRPDEWHVRMRQMHTVPRHTHIHKLVHTHTHTQCMRKGQHECTVSRDHHNAVSVCAHGQRQVTCAHVARDERISHAVCDNQIVACGGHVRVTMKIWGIRSRSAECIQTNKKECTALFAAQNRHASTRIQKSSTQSECATIHVPF